MRNFNNFMTVLAVFLALTLSAAANSFTVDSKSSKLNWTGEKITGKHWGTVNIKNGSVSLNNQKMSGSFEIDMTSIIADDLKNDKATHDKLIGHLKSDDFFSVDNNPTSKFTLKKADKYNPKKGEDYNFMVTGDLTIKGITHEIRFPAKIDIKGKDMTANASFTIDRTKWNIRYGSGSFFDNLGDKVIYDDIKFDLTLKGKSN